MSEHAPEPWNREALYRLLRFSRKNDGPWDDPELWENEDCFSMPDEDDADLIAWAPVIAVERDRLKAQNAELLQELEDRYQQTKCGCGHPACKRCQDDRMTETVITKARGEA